MKYLSAEWLLFWVLSLLCDRRLQAGSARPNIGNAASVLAPGNCDPSTEVVCDGRCVVKASIESFDEGVRKFKEYLQEKTGSPMEIDQISIGEWMGSRLEGQHDLWLTKFLWLRARWGGMCEAQAFQAAVRGLQKGSGEVLKEVLAVNTNLAMQAAIKLPELATEEMIQAAKLGTQSEGIPEDIPEHEELDVALAQPAELKVDKSRRAFSDHEFDEDESADVLPMLPTLQTTGDEILRREEEELKGRPSSRKMPSEFVHTQQVVEERAELWKQKHGSIGNPWEALLSAVRITNQHMILNYETSGYGQSGPTRHVEKADGKLRVYEQVTEKQMDLNGITLDQWKAQVKKSRVYDAPFSKDMAKPKPQTYDPQDTPLTMTVGWVKKFPAHPRDRLEIHSENRVALNKLEQFVDKKNFPSVQKIDKMQLPWWKHKDEENKRKYFQLIFEAQNAWESAAFKM